MASVDARFADDIQQVRSTVEQPVDPVDFSDGERQRNSHSFLYSLLSSLVGLAGMGCAELGLRVLHKHGYTRAVILSTMPLRARLVKIVYGPYRGKKQIRTHTHIYI